MVDTSGYLLRLVLLGPCLCASVCWAQPYDATGTSDAPRVDSVRLASHPNILVVLTDDQGWGDLSLHGNRNLATPNIDGLANDGAQVAQFFVCPVCSPTRAEFLTGRYSPRCGVTGTSRGAERINRDETTIAEIFQDAGYATAAFGKWHNGTQPPYHPNARGFDHFYGFCSGHWGNYFDPILECNGEFVRGKGYVTDDFTNHAIAFMERAGDRPFFCYLAYNTPHSPMQVPDRWWDRFADRELISHHRDPKREQRQHTRAALAMCENIDWNVGRLLQALQRLEIENETIVVFFCDNGPNGFRYNGGMKGRKGSTDDGGVRSPLLVRWPGRIPAGTKVGRIGGAIDLLPTLGDLAGLDVKLPARLDGQSLSEDLQGRPKQSEDRVIVSSWKDRVSARSKRFRLDDQGRLFHMQADPGQLKDVAAQHPKVVAMLQERITDYRRTVLPDSPPERPFSIGFSDRIPTQLPARDGTPHGSIKRSNRFPNCSFFENWTDVEDAVTWEVLVERTGWYDVSVYYACSTDDVGAGLTLSLGSQHVTGKIVHANDAPLRGSENDRVVRQESYVKDFRPLRLGRIALKQGDRGTLKLQAHAIPGREAMEFRGLVLSLIPDQQ